MKNSNDEMEALTEMIRREILEQYGSITRFSQESGIPYSTLQNCIRKGVGGTAYETVTRMCTLLNITRAFDRSTFVFNRRFRDIYDQLCVLDEQGLHTVEAILKVEAGRCGEEDSGVVRTFPSVRLISRKEEEDEHLRDLIREVLKEQETRGEP